jgi:hypothetical protein
MTQFADHGLRVVMPSACPECRNRLAVIGHARRSNARAAVCIVVGWKGTRPILSNK